MLIEIIVGLVLIGLVLYLVTLLPIDPAMMQIIRAVVVVAVIVWLLRLSGLIKI